MNESTVTENKRRVITLLRKSGALTRRELAKEGQMGWATVVKVINQLSEAGIVECLGTSTPEPGGKGRHAYTYALSPSLPLAIGVDVEYRTTRVVLTNLTGDVLKEAQYSTPQEVDEPTSRRFLRETLEDFITKNEIEVEAVDGIGIGKPGIGFPSASSADNVVASKALEECLRDVFGVRVRVETNTKAYTVFEKWASKTFAYSDFIFVSVRTGVGTGIIYEGELYNGSHGLAGEIGHLKVVPNGPPCRCGRSGCMETVVNQHYLYEQYRTNVLDEVSLWSSSSNREALHAGLADLFTRAKNGEDAARRVVGTAAHYLGHCIATAVGVLDITNVLVSGHFGPDGDYLEGLLREEIQANILPKLEFSVKYVPFDPMGHLHGAALLVLQDYFVDIPLSKS